MHSITNKYFLTKFPNYEGLFASKLHQNNATPVAILDMRIYNRWRHVFLCIDNSLLIFYHFCIILQKLLNDLYTIYNRDIINMKCVYMIKFDYQERYAHFDDVKIVRRQHTGPMQKLVGEGNWL